MSSGDQPQSDAQSWAQSWAWAQSQAQQETAHDLPAARRPLPLDGSVPDQQRARRLTAEAVTTLPPGWTVLHERRCPEPGSPVLQHVVVGPPGVVVVACPPSPPPTTTGASGGADGQGAALAAVADAALSLVELVGEGIPAGVGEVRAVLCSGAAGDTPGRVHDVLVCSPESVVGVLTSLPPVLDDGQVGDLAFRLDLELHAASPTVGRPAVPTAPPHVVGAIATPPTPPRTPPPALPPARESVRPTPVPVWLTPEPLLPSPRRADDPGPRSARDREALLRRLQDRERVRRARRARRVAHLVLLAVVLVTFAPSAAAVLSSAFARYAVSQAPTLPTPGPIPGPPTSAPRSVDIR